MQDKIIGYTTGVFDMFHIGHLNVIRRAKEQCDHLIVGVSTDELVEREKQKKPVIPFEERVEIVKALRYVDEVVPQPDKDKYAAWERYHFHRMFVGDDWKGKFDFLKEEGVEVVYLPRTPEISSSQIKRDLYDANAVDGESKVNHDEIDTDPKK